MNTALETADEVIGALGFIIAHTAFYCILLLRLHISFADSIFQIGRAEESFYWVAVGAITATDCLAADFLHFLHNTSWVFLVFIWLNAIVGALLIWSFTKRLFRLVVEEMDWFRQNSDESLVSVHSLTHSLSLSLSAH